MLQDLATLPADDEDVHREIVISLQAEIEEREKLIEREEAESEEQKETKTDCDKGSSETSERCEQNVLQTVTDLPTTTTTTDTSENNNRKETPKFKKSFLSQGRNYRKPSHEDD